MEGLDRIINLKAIEDNSVEVNLLKLGYSSSICKSLRKAMGLIEKKEANKYVAVRIVDEIKKNEEFRIHIKDLEVPHIKPYKIELKIVYEDEDIVVIDKPFSLAVIATHNHYGKSLANALANIYGDFVYRPVNRLDRDTSGLMIIAKNQLAHSILSKAPIIKRYHALVEGKLEGEGKWDYPLGLESSEGMKRKVIEDGKEAVTLYKSINIYKNYTLLELELLTGRTHQIRAHAAHVGHPLLCDKLYGRGGEVLLENGKKLDRQALHSAYLEFDSPLTKKHLVLVSKASFE